MLQSDNEKVCYVASRFLNHVNSIIGANLHIIGRATGCDVNGLLCKNSYELKNLFLVKYDKLLPNVHQIMEIKGAIDGDIAICGFTTQELSEMLTHICCD